MSTGPTRILVCDEHGKDLPFEVETDGPDMIITVDTEEIRSEAFEDGLIEGQREGYGYGQE